MLVADLVGVGAFFDDRFTSRGMIDLELRMARSADALERRGHAVAERHIDRALASANDNGLTLSGEQQSALRHVTRGRNLGLVIGYAGSGKSAMLGVARDAWEAEGSTVRGAALSGIAAENLEHGSGIASRTIASLEHQWAQDRERLMRNDVLVIDEAGMIGSRQMERVLKEAEHAGAKVVLVGDAQQLQAIEAGAAFRALAERHGAVEINEIRRQREDWQRGATRQLATGRTGEALRTYEEKGMIRGAETREAARTALVEGWNADRQSAPAQSRLILSHTRDEVRALNDLARDTLKLDGTLAAEIAVKTAQGERLFAERDRIMFLRNERDLSVKNGTLATVERVTPEHIDARLDDGRSVGFDLKHYADIDHGYAATIHKSQSVTVDRVHVLATPGLDQHSTYVALSRHRDSVHLHYGRDDFDGPERLARVLGRERAKDSTLDYQAARDGFAEQRGYQRSAILDTLAKERFADPAHIHHEPTPRRGMFDGLRLGPDKERAAPARGVFDDIRIAHDAPTPAGAADNAAKRLGSAVQNHARSLEEAGRMTTRNLPPLEYQKAALARTHDTLDAVRPSAATDLAEAFARNPALVAEAANGRTAQAMQIEAEVRADPDLRADRFVQAWQRHMAERDRLNGWENDGPRGAVESQMKALAKGTEKDPALATALGKRASDLGLGKQWALEWRPGSRNGGIGRDMVERMRAPSMAQELMDTLGRGRDLGMSR